MREVIGHDFHFLDGFLCSKEAVTLSLKSRWFVVFLYERRDLTYDLLPENTGSKIYYSPTILILLCFWVRVGKADPWCSRHALIMEPYVDVIMDAAGSEVVEFFHGNQKSSLNNG